MRKIKLLDVIKLKDGRIGTVVEIFTAPDGYMIELKNSDEMDTEDAMPIVKIDDIAEVVWTTQGVHQKVSA